MECPEENVVVDYVKGDVDEALRREIEAHLDDCPACLQVVGELARIFQAEAAPGDESGLHLIGDLGAMPVGGADGTFGGLTLVETSPMSGAAREQDVVTRLREGAKLGRYVVLSRVGAGGMGVVFGAYDPELDRKVAIKLLRSAPGASGPKELADQRSRLLREAQAMAKLSHPNVITVHDVGTFEGQVFVAMEFIDGGTLSMWLREKQRSWREVLPVLLAAGRGLAAAHAAGLVHRDFKPDNVLMGRDGRVLVTDFGLARPAAGKTDNFAQVGAPGSMPGTRALGLALTQTGALVGTPAYMAPEQLGGERTDALTDQFSFCVALYEGLYGERPFAGKVLAELIANVTDGNVKPAPQRSTVPRWLRRALLRGLAVDPEARHPSMDVLLAALVRNPWRRWQQVALVAVPAVTIGGIVAAYEREQPGAQSYCKDIAEKLDGVWDDERRGAVQARFDAADLPYAADALRSIERVLDPYAAMWIELQTQACRDEVEGARPQAVLALQMTCLERRRQSLGALTELLADADAATIERSVDAAKALPALEICADLEILMARESTQDDLDPAIAREIDQALARAKVLRDTSLLNHARSAVEPLVARSVEVGYTRGEAFARELLATTLDFAGETVAAERAYHDALSAALASGSAEIVVRASLGLIWITGEGNRPVLEADRWYAHGKGALARMGGDPELEAELERSLAQAYLQHGDPQRAEVHARKSMEIRETAFGPDHESVGAAASTMGQLLVMQGKFVEARTQFERALTLIEAELGPAHPDTAAAVANLGSAWAESGEYAKAIEYFERALAIESAALGPDHVRVGAAHHNLASSMRANGQIEPARKHAERELEIVGRGYPSDHPDVARAVANLASFDAAAGNHAAALDGFTKALGLVTGKDKLQAAVYQTNVADQLLELDRAEEALATMQVVLATRREILGEEHPEMGNAYATEAMALLALRRFDDAVTPAQRGVELLVDAAGEPLGLASAHFALARALWDATTGRDRARAIAEAKKALEQARRAPASTLDETIDAWLAVRG
jgi:tetratricopeptide (TPR) repeat protein